MFENSEDYCGIDVLRAVLNGWLYGSFMPNIELSKAEAGVFADLTESNRLDAFMWAVLPDGILRDSLIDKMYAWKQAYEQSLIRNMQQFRAALDVYSLLENAGIKCIGLRGPFAGASLYKDVALRHFTDIDLLIPANMRDKAWDILVEAGFAFSHPFMTRSACIRHHLEWPFRHEQLGVSIDLHWAIDHPYKLYRVNYSEIFEKSYIYSCGEGKWRRPCVKHEVLLTSLHAEKECRRMGSKYSNQTMITEGITGLWRHSIDLSILMRNYSDFELILAEASEWQARKSVYSSLKSAEALFPGKEFLLRDSFILGECAMNEQNNPKNARISKRKRGNLAYYGFRKRCLLDVGRYLLPPSNYFQKKAGLGLLCCHISHTIKATGKLGIGVLDFMWLRFRQIYRGRSANSAIMIVLMMLFSSLVFAHDFGDDVGDISSEAEALIVNGGSIERVLEIDMDEDWYTFLASPYIDYTIYISKGTVFDLSLDRFERESDVVIVATNTLLDYVSVTNNWTGGRLMERVYIRVTGMFEFTTGTYNIAVSGVMQDTDSDGLPDVWEQYRFTNLIWSAGDDPDSDGMSNESEWLLDTDPNNTESRFCINNISITNGSDIHISWQSSTGGCYIVQCENDLLDGVGWDTLTNISGSIDENRCYTDSLVTSNKCRFYRVIYDN